MMVVTGFKALFHLMKSPHFNTQKQAASALRDLAANSDYKLKLAEEGGIAALVTLCRQVEPALQALAIAGLRFSFFSYLESFKICISLIINLSFFRHLSSNEVLKTPIVEERALRPVLHNAAFNDIDIHLQSAGLLANLSELLVNQVIMVEEGSCITLVNLAYSNNDEVQQDVSRALANLASNEDNHKTLYKQGALTALFKLAESDFDITQRYSAMGIR
jgi:vacuolar protein 8